MRGTWSKVTSPRGKGLTGPEPASVGDRSGEEVEVEARARHGEKRLCCRVVGVDRAGAFR
jgi:hypothetical protein